MTYADHATSQEEKKEMEPPTKRMHTDYQADQLASYKDTPLGLKCVNTVQTLAADMVQKANLGHTGAPIECAPMAHLFWLAASTGCAGRNHSAASPKWWNRDCFVLSNGHAYVISIS